MVDDGIVVAQERPSGGSRFAVKLEEIEISGLMCLSNPRPLQDVGPSGTPLDKWCKLECCGQLLRAGWSVSSNLVLQNLERDGPREFPPRALHAQESYWKCLVRSDTLFGKHSDLMRIAHVAPNNYYVCLLRLEDLTPITALGPEN